MKVKLDQNSPIQQADANVTDGTSNTMTAGKQTKAENPFAKDSFESSSTPRGEANSLKIQDAVDFHQDPAGKTSEEGKVVEDLNVKYTMFLPD